MRSNPSLTIVLDHRFYRLADGSVWTDNLYSNSFWSRYLDSFSSVQIVARALPCESKQKKWMQVNGGDVHFTSLPYYLGPAQYLLKAGAVKEALESALADAEAVILRVPSQLSTISARVLRSLRKPFAVEVVGDAYQALAPGCVKHPGRALFRLWYTHHQRSACSHASASLYVTGVLTKAYPPAPETTAIICSDVALSEGDFCQRPRSRFRLPARRLLTVASLSQMYKGIDVLLQALSICKQAGVEYELTIVGDGQYRAFFADLAGSLGLAETTDFTGHLPAGPLLAEQFHRADLFILPSRTEGMPRALIEAMSRSLPCIATRVGGISELLPDSALVPAGDAEALASKLMAMSQDDELLSSEGLRNFERARAFAAPLINRKLQSFYRAVSESQYGAGVKPGTNSFPNREKHAL